MSRKDVFEGLLPGPVVSDGAWGTQLQALGLRAGQCPDEWNLSNADHVEAVARSYVDAGSRIILTNTFGANRLRLAAYGLAERTVEINRAGARISLRAASGHARVFASIGPSGKLPSMGDVSASELCEVFTEQALTLAEEGVDGVVLETFSDLGEIGAALDAVKDVNIPVVACMVFDSGAARDRTMMGVSPEQAAEALVAGGADVIGANCGRGIDEHIPICRRLRAATDRPLWLKPNAGLPEIVDGRATYRVEPDEFARKAVELIRCGADFVGGCCGTNPSFIKAVVGALGA